jgi:hypothetical protein
MKIKIIYYFILIFLGASCSRLNDRIEKLRRFGTSEFDSYVWSISNEYIRGTMIYDFVTSNSPITDKNFDFILRNLGNSTGYYEYDMNPAYYIGSKPIETDARIYLIAFVIDHESGRVRDIRIRPELE